MSGKTMSPKTRIPTMWQTLLTKYIDLFNSIHGATRKAGDQNWLTHLMVLFHPTITMAFLESKWSIGQFYNSMFCPHSWQMLSVCQTSRVVCAMELSSSS